MSFARASAGPIVTVAVALAALGVAQPAAAQSSVPSGYWALVGGYERDTHGSNYGFFGPAYVGPINSNVAWTARVFGSYLTYEFSDLNSTTKVRSPGVSGALGVQFGGASHFGVYAGPSVNWRKTTVTTNAGTVTTVDETRWGANVGAEAYLRASSHNVVQGLVNYNTTDKYVWGRLSVSESFVGVELIGQGNQDIKSIQFGGFVEAGHSKGSVTLRAGYKRSTFKVGSPKTGLYFGIGFYQRLN